MAAELTLKVTMRSGKKAKALRQQGIIPAVVYGHGTENLSLAVEEKIFSRIYNQAGASTLINLQIDERTPIKVLIQDVQRDPLSSGFLHIDFYQVKMHEKIEAEVNLVFQGEAAAIRELGGVLVKNLDHLKVKCLPQDLVHEISVDISLLKTFTDKIRVSDLKIPANIQILDKPEEIVALVEEPRSEEELKALEEKPVEDVEAVKTVEKPKAEVAEGAEEAKAETKPEVKKEEKASKEKKK